MSKRGLPGSIDRLIAAQKREARRIIAELVATRGFMPLLMKHRNGGQWSAAEKAELLQQLRRISRLSPYLLFLLLPGSALMLPAYAWWLDRRRDRRREQRPDERAAASADESVPESLRP